MTNEERDNVESFSASVLSSAMVSSPNDTKADQRLSARNEVKLGLRERL
jgi:hypothetical protein